jgi:tetratricopeptide (TPR) repeat protein
MKSPLGVCLLFLTFWLIQERALAQGGILHVFVTDTDKGAVGEFQITCSARGCSTELVVHGRATIALPPQIRPGNQVVLRLINRPPPNQAWVIVEPSDGMVTVPSATNSVEIVVEKKGDIGILKKTRVVESIVKRARQNMGQEISKEEFLLALEVLAAAYGLPAKDVIEAVRQWAATAKDPYKQGENALLEGKYSEAIPLLTKSIELRQKMFVDAAFSLGQAYYGLEEYRQAVKTFREALFFEKNDADILSWLGVSLHQIGEYTEAEIQLKRALKIREIIFGEEHPDTARGLHNLANVYLELGNYAEAEKLYQSALTIKEKTLGPQDTSTAQTLHYRGVLNYSLGKYAEAATFYQRALAIRERNLGKDHIVTAQTLHNLGALNYSLGKYAEAATFYQRALAIRESKLGKEHSATAYSLNNLGQLYQVQGKYVEAEDFLKRALFIRERKLGEEHPDTAKSLNNLGEFYVSQENDAKAEPFLKRALDIRVKKFGMVHHFTAQSLYNLAILYSNVALRDDSQEKYMEAENLFKQALEITEKVSGREDLNVAVILESYALLLKEMNHAEEAAKLKSRANEIRKKANPR